MPCSGTLPVISAPHVLQIVLAACGSGVGLGVGTGVGAGVGIGVGAAVGTGVGSGEGDGSGTGVATGSGSGCATGCVGIGIGTAAAGGGRKLGGDVTCNGISTSLAGGLLFLGSACLFCADGTVIFGEALKLGTAICPSVILADGTSRGLRVGFDAAFCSTLGSGASGWLDVFSGAASFGAGAPAVESGLIVIVGDEGGEGAGFLVLQDVSMQAPITAKSTIARLKVSVLFIVLSR